jgi:GNAT superfamily N-acetyltransferase
MQIEIRDIDEETFEELMPECRRCLYWEAPDKFGRDEGNEPKVREDEAIETKRGWFKKASETMGSCGKILYADGKAAGYAQFALPHFFEKVGEYSRELFLPSPDGVLISCLYIQGEYQGQGLGTSLLQEIIEDLRGRGHKSLETYSRDDSATNCSGPTVMYLENGFKVMQTKKWEDGMFSLVRLEL